MGFIFGIFAVPFVFFAKPRPPVKKMSEGDYEAGRSVSEQPLGGEEEGSAEERKNF